MAKQIVVNLPSKADMPKTNEEAMAKFGDAITRLLEKFKDADADGKKKIRRQFRKLGYKLASTRQRGIMIID